MTEISPIAPLNKVLEVYIYEEVRSKTVNVHKSVKPNTETLISKN